MLPKFIDLVIWGHEHESIPELVWSEECNFNVYQPGSTIATSLIDAETLIKHAGILTV